MIIYGMFSERVVHRCGKRCFSYFSMLNLFISAVLTRFFLVLYVLIATPLSFLSCIPPTVSFVNEQVAGHPCLFALGIFYLLVIVCSCILFVNNDLTCICTNVL